MKKNDSSGNHLTEKVPFKHFLLIMRTTFVLLFTCVFCAMAEMSYSQNARVTINKRKTTLKEVLNEIETQTDYLFIYNDEVNTNEEVSVKANHQAVSNVLSTLLKKKELIYTMEGNHILISKKTEGVTEGVAKGLDDAPQQKKKITGTIVDVNGEPIIGANIIETGTTNGTITDTEGNFNLSVSDNAEIQITYIGYLDQTINTAGRSNINVILVEDTQTLDEVVVIGYGTQRKKDLTGAISQIDNRLIELQNQSSATKALEGAVPGITYASVDGQPGNDAALRVRGLGSTNVDASNALVVIDGVPAQGENPLSNMNPQDIATITVLKDAASTAVYGARGANGVILVTTKKGQSGKTKISFQGRFGVNTVGTYDVGQIDSAAGIYEYMWQSIYNSYRFGVNGTGGPVLDEASGEYITNIKKPNVSDEEARLFASQHLFNYIGRDNVFGRNNLGNYQAYKVPGAVYTPDGTGTNRSATMSEAYLIDPQTSKINPNAKLLYDDTYKDALLETNLRQEDNISISGGNEKVNYFLSLGFLSDPSYIHNSRFERYSGRVKIDTNPYKWMKIGANIAYARSGTNYMGTYWQGRNSGSNQGSIMRFVNGHTPIIPVYAHNEDGSFMLDAIGNKIPNTYSGTSFSPLGQTANNYGNTDILFAMNNDVRSDNTSTWNTRTFMEIPFLKYFTFRTDLSYDKINNTMTRYYNGKTGRAAGMGGYFGKRAFDTEVLNIQHRFTYSQDFDKHHVDALVLYEESNWEQESVSWGSYDELLPAFLASSNFVGRYGKAGSAPNPDYGHDIERMKSYLSRINYNYAEKYYLSASIRRDGSSKFKRNRWGTFYSVGGGWRFTSEKFMKWSEDWLKKGKIRASWGAIGNQNAIGRYSGYRTWRYSTTYKESTTGAGIPTGYDYRLSLGGLVNDALTWEMTHTFDIGLDLSLFDRVDLTLDFYNRVTGNSFFNQPVSMLAVGQTSLQQNIAKIRNRGIELEFNADIIRNRDWYWNVTFNTSHYTTILQDLPAVAVPDHVEGLPDGTWETFDGMGWGAAGDISQHSNFYLRGIGRDWYNIYLYKYAGVDENTGLPMYWHRVNAEDIKKGTYKNVKEGDRVKTNNYSKASKFEVGSAIPDLIGGFTTSLSYKKLNLSASFAYQIGGKFFDHNYGEYLYASTIAQHYRMMFVSKDVAGNTWLPDRTGTKFPMQWYPTDVNCYFDGSSTAAGNWNYTTLSLFDASYLRIKNVTISYTVLPNFLKRIKLNYLNGLKVFISGDNLALFSAHKGVDPSMSASGGYGVGAYTFPNIRSFTFGINMDF